MDDVLRLQKEFTDMCLQDCMLQAPKLLQILRSILDVSLNFASYVDVSVILAALFLIPVFFPVSSFLFS